MTEQRVQRRLAAILAADVVGYSALMQRAEEATYAEFERLKREVIGPSLPRHDGRLIKTTGDGALVEFASPLAAVRCALEIQENLASGGSPLRLRVGLNLGDVIVGQDGELYGDGINIAVRLEGIADPGGILISEKVYSEVEGKLDVGFEDRGGQQLKNISRPVRAYAVRAGAHSAPTEGLGTALPLPDKPSIAVLPFENMSGDPEQEYFADGMVEEIITALSRFKWLFVIARNSSFAYKGRAVDVKQVGREFGVRYVLEGSVRKSRNRVRITGQLIDASTGAHLWADRFDASLEDVFDLQDSVASTVAGEIAPRLEQAEIERAKRKPTGSLDAYDNYLRGMAIIPHAADRESTLEALRFFHSAIEHDPNFASAHAWAAYCYVWLKVNEYATISNEEIAATLRHVTKAAEWGQDDAAALGLSGFALAYIGFDLDGAVSLIDRALTLNPNLAAAWHWSGWVSSYRGEPEKAIEHLARAMRLSPLDPLLYGMQAATALAEFFAGRYDQAVSWADKACLARPQFTAGWTIAAASNALAGDLGKAQRATMRFLQINPAARVSRAKYRIPLRRSEDLARFEEGLRKAGLPE